MKIQIDRNGKTIPTDDSWQFGIGNDHACQMLRADVCEHVKLDVYKRQRYPFGYGLSYTRFEYEVGEITENSMTVSVTNTGNCPGKDVLQVYVSKPEGTLEHEVRALAGFAKTK